MLNHGLQENAVQGARRTIGRVLLDVSRDHEKATYNIANRGALPWCGPGVGPTPRLSWLCGKPPNASWWLLLWLSHQRLTISASWAMPVGLVAVSAPPISLAVRRRS